MNSGEPDRAGSFAVDEQIRNTPPKVLTSPLCAARATRSERPIAASSPQVAPDILHVIPFASHSLKSLIIAGPDDRSARSIIWWRPD